MTFSLTAMSGQQCGRSSAQYGSGLLSPQPAEQMGRQEEGKRGVRRPAAEFASEKNRFGRSIVEPKASGMFWEISAGLIVIIRGNSRPVADNAAVVRAGARRRVAFADSPSSATNRWKPVDYDNRAARVVLCVLLPAPPCRKRPPPPLVSVPPASARPLPSPSRRRRRCFGC